MAIAKRHSTTFEAMDIGSKMDAKYTILFHFSQRYPKLPTFLKEGNENDPYIQSTGLAFDLMSLKISNLPLVSQIIPLIHYVFPPEEENDENN
jgi:ribonuclease Z